jgi:hypothetical protein
MEPQERAIGAFLGGIGAVPGAIVGAIGGAWEGEFFSSQKEAGTIESENLGDATQEKNGVGTYSTEITNEINIDSEGIVNAIEGTSYAYLQSGQMIAQQLMQLQYILAAPVHTESTTDGYSTGGSKSTATEQYQEVGITNSEAFLTQESWETATAVDTAHAANLWFTYEISNTGTEYAKEIGDIAFNVYLGDSDLPIYTYFVGPDIGGDGKFHNLMPENCILTLPNRSHYPSNR